MKPGMLWRAALLLLMLVPAWAQAEPDGVVLRTQGTVTLDGEDGARALSRGDAVNRGAALRTGPGARAKIRMRDGTVLTLGADTVFRVERYRTGRDGEKPPEGVFRLLEGVFRAVTGAITDKGGQILMKTRVATVGVRGTDFWGGFYFSEALDVILLEGSGVFIRNGAGTVRLNRPKEMTTVRGPDRAPERPALIAPERLQRAAGSVAFD
ncbi:FecR family protein [Thiohalorhabdus sp. Cl-TMA]|uniref:FecR domain-containing protein n=1 Tax=Thiohalorhabdus methylotrophus TaxID=3242694 RepID=A0ABV4TTF1_9GAMM